MPKKTKRAGIGLVPGALVLALASVWPGSAHAANECTCMTGLAPGTQRLGYLAGVRGSVLVSQPRGFASGWQGAPLSLGSVLIVGPDGAAQVNMGRCSVPAPANSTVRILASGQEVCVNVSEAGDGLATTGSTHSADLESNDRNPLWPVVGGFGLFGLGAGSYFAFTGDDKASD